MKQYTKNWLTAFLVSVLIITCLIFAFLFFTDSTPNTQNNTAKPETSVPEQKGITSEEYENINDNVGAVTFTEDQVTELARNMFYLDNFVNNLNVDLEENGTINVSAKIKDTDKLIENYPELKGYKTLLYVIENKKISVNGKINDNNGMAKFEITEANVDGMDISPQLISPFMENGDFAEIFNVAYDSIEIDSGVIVFKNGLPDILQY